MELTVDIEKSLPGFSLKVSFTAGKDTLGILGASGSGKSMTLRCIAGLETPTKGRIILNGRTLFDSKQGINLPSRFRNVGFLFQNYALFPHLNVAENIAFGLKGLPKTVQTRRIKEKIAMIQLEGLEERYPHQLSGGQQQRVALARTLAVEPEALLLDEPFSALDHYLRGQMEKQLTETLAAYNGVSLFVTHDLEESYRVCRDLIIMEQGEKVAWGDKETLFQKPPNVTTAQLTGCRNLSRARAAAPGLVEALDWGCTLRVNQPLPADLTHIGIRTHHLAVVEDPNLDNTFPCWVTQTGDSPCRVTLFLKLNPYDTGPCHLQAEVAKETWALLKDRSFPWYIRINPEHLFIINDKLI